MDTTTDAILVQLDNGDEDGPTYSAARLGEPWNGMAAPFFYRDVAQQFFADLDRESVENRGEFRYLYDPITDAFVVSLSEWDGHPSGVVHEQYRPIETVWGILYGPFEGYTFAACVPDAGVPLVAAVRLVYTTRRIMSPEVSVAEACDHVRATMTPDALDAPGMVMADAYRAVLGADPKALIDAEAVVVLEVI